MRRVGVAKTKSPDQQKEAKLVTPTDDTSSCDVIAAGSQQQQEEEPENVDGNCQSDAILSTATQAAPTVIPESAPVLHDASNKSGALANTRASRTHKAHGLNLESLQSRMDKIRQALDSAAASGDVNATTERFHAIQEQNCG